MKQLALILLALLFSPHVWSEEAEQAFPRNWTVNVGGTWRITGCGNETTLRVKQEGSRLSLEDGGLAGEVHGHSVSFQLPTLSCLPQAKAMRFDGEADGTRIAGMLHNAEDAAQRIPVTIHLQREFMLSFDDGPLPGKTDRVLDTLRQLRTSDGKPVRAAFFTVGNAPSGFWEGRAYYAPYEVWTHKGSMKAYPDLVVRIQKEGHVIGSHTAHHAWFRWPRFADVQSIVSELKEWEAALPVVQHEKLFRSPYLVVNEAVLSAARQAGYQLVQGETVGDAAPWAGVDALEWKAMQILETHDGSRPAMLIFHDIFPATYLHLSAVVSWLQQQGYALVDFNATRLETARQ